MQFDFGLDPPVGRSGLRAAVGTLHYRYKFSKFSTFSSVVIFYRKDTRVLTFENVFALRVALGVLHCSVCRNGLET
jgi:hypothetical protein